MRIEGRTYIGIFQFLPLLPQLNPDCEESNETAVLVELDKKCRIRSLNVQILVEQRNEASAPPTGT